MAKFSASATGPDSIEAEFTGLGVESYARTIYINIVGMGSSYQEEWGLGADEDPDSYYAEFDGLDPDTEYTVACTVFRNSDWYIVADWSKKVTTKAIYFIEGAISTQDTGGILSVIPDEEIECVEGDEVTFKATVDTNHIFRGWYSKASGSETYLVSRNNPYTITPDEDVLLYARAVKVSLDISDLTYNSVTAELSIAYEDFDYYIRVWDNTNEELFIKEQSISYDDVYNGYIIENLEPETSYSINIGYVAGDEAKLVWIFDSEHTATFTTPARPRYAVGIRYANGITSGQFWGDNITSANLALAGTAVSFSATVKSGYEFFGWYDLDENFISSKNPYTINSIQEETMLIAKAVPETLFSVDKNSIVITTIADDVEEIRICHDGEVVKTITSFLEDIITIDSGLYPSSTYDIEIDYNCDGVSSYESVTYKESVTTEDPTLSATVHDNKVILNLSNGRAYTNDSWSAYFSSPHKQDTFTDLSGGSTSATFSNLKYNTAYMFYCNYRVANGSSYTSKTIGTSANTTGTSPIYTVACYKDDNTVASFTKSPNSTFQFRDEVTVTAEAFPSNYQYEYAIPKIYQGTSANGDLVSSSGSYTYIVVESTSFYAVGKKSIQEYEADIEATDISDTSQKITITNLSSTSGLNSYYYITQNTSDSPVTSLSSATSFTRSSGSITLTNLQPGVYTYYCYVYNSKYGYYYQIGSVTFTSGIVVELWEWTNTERNAFNGKGSFNTLTALRWIDFCKRFNEVVDARNYVASLKITVPNITSGDILTAEEFNHVTNQIAWLGHAYFNQNEFYNKRVIVNKGDPVLGQYFIDLETALNNLISAL